MDCAVRTLRPLVKKVYPTAKTVNRSEVRRDMLRMRREHSSLTTIPNQPRPQK